MKSRRYHLKKLILIRGLSWVRGARRKTKWMEKKSWKKRGHRTNDGFKSKKEKIPRRGSDNNWEPGAFKLKSFIGFSHSRKKQRNPQWVLGSSVRRNAQRNVGENDRGAGTMQTDSPEKKKKKGIIHPGPGTKLRKEPSNRVTNSKGSILLRAGI